jgi:hypothetical protein
MFSIGPHLPILQKRYKKRLMYIHEKGKGAKEKCQNETMVCTSKEGLVPRIWCEDVAIVGFQLIAKMLALWFIL